MVLSGPQQRLPIPPQWMPPITRNSSNRKCNNNNNNSYVYILSIKMPPLSMVPSSSNLDNHDNEDKCDDDDNDEEEDDDEDEYDNEDEKQEGGETKRSRTGGILSKSSSARQKLSGEITVMLQDVSRNPKEKKQWVLSQLVQLEEKGVKFQCEGLELEKQRIKWIKFSSTKEREMKKMKIDNERNRLENERMVLLLRQKEIELLFLEQHPNSNPSYVTD